MDKSNQPPFTHGVHWGDDWTDGFKFTLVGVYCGADESVPQLNTPFIEVVHEGFDGKHPPLRMAVPFAFAQRLVPFIGRAVKVDLKMTLMDPATQLPQLKLIEGGKK